MRRNEGRPPHGKAYVRHSLRSMQEIVVKGFDVEKNDILTGRKKNKEPSIS